MVAHYVHVQREHFLIVPQPVLIYNVFFFEQKREKQSDCKSVEIAMVFHKGRQTTLLSLFVILPFSYSGGYVWLNGWLMPDAIKSFVKFRNEPTDHIRRSMIFSYLIINCTTRRRRQLKKFKNWFSLCTRVVCAVSAVPFLFCWKDRQFWFVYVSFSVCVETHLKLYLCVTHIIAATIEFDGTKRKVVSKLRANCLGEKRDLS